MRQQFIVDRHLSLNLKPDLAQNAQSAVNFISRETKLFRPALDMALSALTFKFIFLSPKSTLN
jgi:hypothetical protein